MTSTQLTTPLPVRLAIIVTGKGLLHFPSRISEINLIVQRVVNVFCLYFLFCNLGRPRMYDENSRDRLVDPIYRPFTIFLNQGTDEPHSCGIIFSFSSRLDLLLFFLFFWAAKGPTQKLCTSFYASAIFSPICNALSTNHYSIFIIIFAIGIPITHPESVCKHGRDE